MSSKPPADRPAATSAIDDPYTELLLLPAGERPPHAYQMLELELFCPHPEKIEFAVRRQFRKIKPYEEHPDRATREKIQDVLTHLASARAILTDPERKQAYDDELAARLGLDREAYLLERPASRVPEFELKVIAGPERVGSRLELVPDQTVTIGSDPHCTLTLPSLRMAALHVQLDTDDEGWMLRAVSAAHVTLVNDQRCNAFLLADGDLVDAGGYRLLMNRLGRPTPKPAQVPPPLSLIIREGPSIPQPVMNAVWPAAILIGNCETALWQLPDRHVARHHARIEASGGWWELSDLGSGTTLSGDAVKTSVLQHRDQLVIGRFRIQVSFRR